MSFPTPSVPPDLPQQLDPSDPEGLASALQQVPTTGDERNPGLAKLTYDYTIRWNEERRTQLGLRIRAEIQRYLDENQRRRSLIQQWRRDFRLLPQQPSNRWEESSEVTSHLTRAATEGHATRLDQQIVMVDPPLTVEAVEQDAIEAAPQIEEALAASLEESDWKWAQSGANKELAICGDVMVRLTYEEQYRKCPEQQADLDEKLFAKLVAAGVIPAEAYLKAIKTGADGLPKMKLGWVRKLISAGPRYKVIPWTDSCLLPSHVRDPAEARGIGERLMVSGSELLAGVREGKYLEDEVHALLERASDSVNQDRSEPLDTQALEGSPATEPVGGSEDAHFRWYELWELCWRQDFDGDGEDEWGWVTLHGATGKILRLQYLPWEHGEPHYDLYRYDPTVEERVGTGIPELVAVYQAADTAVLNQIVDSGDLAVNNRGNYFYDKDKHHPERLISEMGVPYPVEGVPQDVILPFPPSALPPEQYQIRQEFKNAVDLVTNTSNVSLGKETDTQKTLGEVQLVQAAGDQAFETKAFNLALQIAKTWDKHRLLLAQFGDNGEVQFRKSAEPGLMIDVTDEQGAPMVGPDGQPQQVPAAMIAGQPVPAPHGYAIGTIPAALLRKKVRILPAGLKQLSSLQARIQQAQAVGNILLTNPLTAQLPDVQKLAIEYQLRALRASIVQPVLDAIEKAQAAQAAQAAAMNQLAMQAALHGGAMQGQQQAQADQQQQEAHGAAMRGNEQTQMLQSIQAQQAAKELLNGGAPQGLARP